MKRNLLFAAALMAGVAVSAQEIGEMDFSLISSETAVVVPAGTVVAASASINVTAAFEDSYKTTGVNTDEFEDFLINDQAAGVSNGVTGSTNPTSVAGNPANNYDAPVAGCVYSFTAPGEAGQPAGYFYALGKLSTNKQYWVVEDAQAIGYELNMVAAGEVCHYVVPGEGEYNYLSDASITAAFPDLAATGWTTGTPSLDQMSGYTRGDWAGTGAGCNGMGYFKFPIYGGLTYYFGAAGSKMSLCGFYYDQTGDAVVKLHDNDGAVADLQISPENGGNAISSVESAAEVVAEEYYTVSGVRVAEMVPGLNLVKQTLSDGSVKTVKVIK